MDDIPAIAVGDIIATLSTMPDRLLCISQSIVNDDKNNWTILE